MTQNYEAEQIITLEGLEHIRKRPSVYIGDISNPNHILLEILANSLDEAMNGYGNEILISINKKVLRVEDFGRGIPIGIREDGKTTLEAAASVLNTGGKFDTASFSNSLGTNGQGLKICNALSASLTVTTYRDGKFEKLDFARGELLKREEGKSKRKNGVTVEFVPDSEIFKVTNEIDVTAFRNIVKQMSFLTKGVKYTYVVNGKSEEFLSKNGLIDFMKELCKDREIVKNQFYCANTVDKMTLEVCMTYTSAYSDTVKLFANNGENTSGTHLTEFRTILTREINKYAREQGLLKEKDENLSGVDLQEGQVLILNIKAPDMLYEGQTKTKVTSTDIKPFIREVVTQALKNYMMLYPNDVKSIIEKALESKRARAAAKNAREKVRKPAAKKGLRAKMEITDKLTDCDSKDRKKCELLLTEGKQNCLYSFFQ